jgi:hypothetical protein
MKPAQSSANKKTMRRKQKTLSIWTKASIAAVRNATQRPFLIGGRKGRGQRIKILGVPSSLKCDSSRYALNDRAFAESKPKRGSFGGAFELRECAARVALPLEFEDFGRLDEGQP